MIENITKFIDVFITFIISCWLFGFALRQNKLVKEKDEPLKYKHIRNRNLLFTLSLILLLITTIRIIIVIIDTPVDPNKIEKVKIDNIEVSMPGNPREGRIEVFKDDNGNEQLTMCGYQSKINNILYSFIRWEYLRNNVDNLDSAYKYFYNILIEQGYKILKEADSKVNEIDFKEIFACIEGNNNKFAYTKLCLLGNKQYMIGMECDNEDIYKTYDVKRYFESIKILY